MKNYLLFITVVALMLSLVGCDNNTEALKDLQNTLEEMKEEEVFSDLSVSNMDEKKVNDQYSILIPSNFSISNTLNPDASLQYNNLAQEKYFIVIDESKQDFIDVMMEGGLYDENVALVDNFAGLQISGFDGGMKITSQTSVLEERINGMDARLFSFDAEVPGISVPISYFTAFLVGQERIYTLMGWTLESDKEKYQSEVNTIIRSIKEI